MGRPGKSGNSLANGRGGRVGRGTLSYLDARLPIPAKSSPKSILARSEGRTGGSFRSLFLLLGSLPSTVTPNGSCGRSSAVSRRLAKKREVAEGISSSAGFRVSDHLGREIGRFGDADVKKYYFCCGPSCRYHHHFHVMPGSGLCIMQPGWPSRIAVGGRVMMCEFKEHGEIQCGNAGHERQKIKIRRLCREVSTQ